MRNVKAGIIDATSQQYPLLMAAGASQRSSTTPRPARRPSGYTDTGVNLIAQKAVAGVPSKNVAYGLANCWG